MTRRRASGSLFEQSPKTIGIVHSASRKPHNIPNRAVGHFTSPDGRLCTWGHLNHKNVPRIKRGCKAQGFPGKRQKGSVFSPAWQRMSSHCHSGATDRSWCLASFRAPDVCWAIHKSEFLGHLAFDRTRIGCPNLLKTASFFAADRFGLVWIGRSKQRHAACNTRGGFSAALVLIKKRELDNDAVFPPPTEIFRFR